MTFWEFFLICLLRAELKSPLFLFKCLHYIFETWKRVKGGVSIFRYVNSLKKLFLLFRLAAITIHSFTPTLDPVAPVSLLDKISYLMGVHEKSAIVIVDVGAWSTIVYTYIFHRHVSDGSFHIEKEYKNTILPGLFSDEVAADKTLLTRKIDDILNQAVKNLPNSVFRLRLRPQDCRSEECRPPMIVKVSNEALSLNKNRVSSVC